METNDQLPKQNLSCQFRPAQSKLQTFRGRSLSRENMSMGPVSMRSQTHEQGRARLERYSQAPGNFYNLSRDPNQSQVPLELSRRISKLQDAYNNNKESVDFYLRESIKESQTMFGSRAIIPAQLSIRDLKRSLALDPVVRKKILVMQKDVRESEITERELEPVYPEYVIYKTREVDLNNRIDPEVGQIAIRKQKLGTEQPDYYKIIFYPNEPVVEGKRRRFRPRTVVKRGLGDPTAYIDKKIDLLMSQNNKIQKSDKSGVKPLIATVNMDASILQTLMERKEAPNSILDELNRLGTQSLLSDEEKDQQSEVMDQGEDRKGGQNLHSELSRTRKDSISPNRKTLDLLASDDVKALHGDYKKKTDKPAGINVSREVPGLVSSTEGGVKSPLRSPSKNRTTRVITMPDSDEQETNLLSVVEADKKGVNPEFKPLSASKVREDEEEDAANLDDPEEEYDHVKLDFLDDLLYKNIPAIPEEDEDDKTYTSSHLPSDKKRRIRKSLNSMLKKGADSLKNKQDGSDRDGSSYKLSLDFSKETKTKSKASTRKRNNVDSANSGSNFKSKSSSKRQSQGSDTESNTDPSKFDTPKDGVITDLYISNFNKKDQPVIQLSPSDTDSKPLADLMLPKLAQLLAKKFAPVVVFEWDTANLMKLPKGKHQNFESVEPVVQELPTKPNEKQPLEKSLLESHHTLPQDFSLSAINEESVEDYAESIYTNDQTIRSSNMTNKMAYDDESYMDSDMGASYNISSLTRTTYRTNASGIRLGVQLPVTDVVKHYDDGRGYCINIKIVDNEEIMTVDFEPVVLAPKLKEEKMRLNSPIVVYECHNLGFVDLRKPLPVKLGGNFMPVESYSLPEMMLKVFGKPVEVKSGKDLPFEKKVVGSGVDDLLNKSFGSNQTVKRSKVQPPLPVKASIKEISQLSEPEDDRQRQPDAAFESFTPEENYVIPETKYHMNRGLSDLVSANPEIKTDPQSEFVSINIFTPHGIMTPDPIYSSKFDKLPKEKNKPAAAKKPVPSTVNAIPESLSPSQRRKDNNKANSYSRVQDYDLLSPMVNPVSKRRDFSNVKGGEGRNRQSPENRFKSGKKFAKPDKKMTSLYGIGSEEGDDMSPSLVARKSKKREDVPDDDINQPVDNKLITLLKTEQTIDSQRDSGDDEGLSNAKEVTNEESSESSEASLQSAKLNEDILNNHISVANRSRQLITSSTCCVFFFILSSFLWIILFKTLSDKTETLEGLLFRTPTLGQYYGTYESVYKEFEKSDDLLQKGKYKVKYGSHTGYMEYSQSITKFLKFKKKTNVNMLKLKTYLSFFQKRGMINRLLAEKGLDDMESNTLANNFGIKNIGKIEELNVPETIGEIRQGVAEMKKLLFTINEGHKKYENTHKDILEIIDELFRQAFVMIDEYGKFYIHTNHIWIAQQNIGRHTNDQMVKFIKEVEKNHVKYYFSENNDVQLSLLKHLNGAKVESMKRLEVEADEPSILGCRIMATFNDMNIEDFKTIFNMSLAVDGKLVLDENANFNYEITRDNKNFMMFQLLNIDKGRSFVDMFAILYNRDVRFTELNVYCLQYIDYPKLESFGKD